MVDANNSDRERQQHDVVSTPEGDNEFAPDTPLSPAAVEQAVEGLQVPKGNAPAVYDSDQPDEVKEMVDKLSIGQILT